MNLPLRSGTMLRLIALALLLAQPAAAQPAPTAPAPEAATPAVAAPAPDAAVPPGDPAALPPVEAALPHDLSPWGMFAAADPIVKGVMIGLALASLLTWTVWLAKTLQLAQARRRLARVQEAMAGAGSLTEAAERVAGLGGAGAGLVHAAQQEFAASADIPGGNIKERVASRLERGEAAAGRQLQDGIGLLATIGSTAPFVGLFGTVWGIMNAFVGIAETQTTNLAVVAPGIAEALLATALGLVAAIPAVVFYNGFVRGLTGYRAALRDAGAAIERLVGRDLDRSRLQRLRPAA